MKISVADAKNKLPELIKAVEAGESVTICRRGIPVVDIVPTKTNSTKNPIFGSMKERITIKDVNWWKPMTEDEVESFMDGQY